MTRCAACGGPSSVYDTRTTPEAVRRRRQCDACGERWTTYEVRREQLARGAAALAPMPAPKPRKKRTAAPALPPRVRALLRRGYDVPPSRQAEWETLRRAGYTAIERKAAMRLE